MDQSAILEQVRRRYLLVAATLDERARCTVATAEALALGWGGISLVARATGLAHMTISQGIQELQVTRPPVPAGHTRRPGGGRKPLATTDPTLPAALEELVEPTTRGDPQSPLRWTWSA